MLQTLYESTLKSLPLLVRGKVRDVYAVGDEHLLIVTTDRLSAFDVVLPDPIPGKGAVLTAVSNFWFERTRSIIPNHLSGTVAGRGVAGRRRACPGRGACHRCQEAQGVTGRGHCAWLPDRFRLEGLPASWAGCAVYPCSPVCSWPTNCRPPSLRRQPRPMPVCMMKTLTSTRPAPFLDPGLPNRFAMSAWKSIQAVPAYALRTRHHYRGYQV